MSYLPTSGVGSVIGDVSKFTLNIAADPSLGKVINLIDKISNLPGVLGSKSKSASGPGVGLANVVRPLEVYLTIRQKPWIVPVLATGIITTIFALGVMTGRARGK